MKIIKQHLLLAFIAVFTFSSCNDENINESNIADETKNFINEGYCPTETGNVIEVIYAGRTVELLEVGDGMYLYDGDVLLGRKDFTLPGEPITEGVYAGNTWSNRTVHWKYGRGRKPQGLIDAWEGAMEAWENDLGFTFIEVSKKYRGDYIEVISNTSGSAYSTSIGRAGGKQIISFDYRYFSTGSMIHEIGHAVGLHHEQKRPDRDDYIIVNYSNIRSSWTSQYDACNNCTPDGTFDFGSIMLYGPYAGSSVVYDTSIPAMTKLDGSTWTAQRSHLSSGDMDAIDAMY